MRSGKNKQEGTFLPIEDAALLGALNALGRSINIIATYGTHHPAFKQATSAAMVSMQALFIERKKVVIGAFNGVMAVDEVPVNAVGTLQKSLERRLVRLRITGLRIARGISEAELTKLAELLASTEAEDFNSGINQASLPHIVPEATRFEAVHEGQTVASEGDLAGAGGTGVLVIEDELSDPEGSSGEASVHVEQIVAFLQGGLDAEDGEVSEELAKLAADPDRLGKIIMESVAIRQQASELSGESLSDVVLGCLRRTYDGLRKQPAFQTSEGVANLKKSLLLLEKNMLEKMRNIAGESNPEVDRQIVQAIREVDESLGFELAAHQYMGHRDASVHVEQIVAFLQGGLDAEDGEVSEELAKLAADPDRLGQLIMEAAAIRQQTTELSGESLSDVVLGCLRRTYDGLRKQPAFQTSEGVANLKKSLLLLEKNMLEKMRSIAGKSDPGMDRKIVQAIREMDESLGFQLAATQYMGHRDALEENKRHMEDYVRSKGVEVAGDLLENTGFPPSDWHRIVVDSRKAGSPAAQPPIADGLNALTTVFEKLERLMKADKTDETQMKELLGQASDNLDDTIFSTQEKLTILSKQLEDTGTIGGQAREMSRKELLSSIAEISQELMQPLTAINASLEMMLGGYVGKVNSEQRGMLDMASNSGAHLTFLMKELIEIVGCPSNKGIDDRFHTTSEQVVLMEQEDG